MNSTLYRQGMKGSWKLLLIFGAVLAMYFIVIITMFDPSLGSALDELNKAMPELMSIVGMNNSDSSLVGFIASYLYGFLMLVFPMVFSILTANRLVARHVERGSMAYLVVSPVSRVKVILTQLAVLVSGIIILVIYAFIIGVVSSEILFPGELDIISYLYINLGVLTLQLFIGGVCFLASTIFNETKYSIALGAGITALGFIIQMLANAGQQLENAKYATFFTLFNPQKIIAGDGSAMVSMIILFIGAIILYVCAINVFSKKDIPV